MKIDYSICNKEKCDKCEFIHKEGKIYPICPDTKKECKPVRKYINKFFEKYK